MNSSWLAPTLHLAQDLAPLLLSLLHLGCALAVTLHALLNKRQVQTTIGWIALAWLAPLVGAGGIGMALNAAIDLIQWQRVSLILFTIFVVVILIETVVTQIRKRVI